MVEFRVACPAGPEQVDVSARLYEAARAPLAWLTLAPGAGAGQDSAFIVGFARELASRGLHVVTFNFPYMERGRRVPDRNETLERCWDRVLRAVGQRAGADSPLFAGGKSMGGRIASQVAARQDLPVTQKGLVFLGYPLHPPGRPDERRTAHWPRIRVPALFVQGSRDSFAAPDELRAALAGFGGDARVMIVEGGDHSFKVPRSAGRSQGAVHADIQDAIVAWVRDRLA